MQTISLSNEQHQIEMTKLVIGHAKYKDLSFMHSCFDQYLAEGGNTIDTARIYDYGLGERMVGNYLKTKQRDRIVLITKCAHFDPNFYPIRHRVSETDIRFDVETSLRELQTDYIDILFLHRDDIRRPVESIMPVLHELVSDGKVRMIGTSNWTGGRISAANDFALENGLTPFSVSQIHHSLALTTAAQSGDVSHLIMDSTEYQWYKQQQFPVMAWSPTGGGFFSKLANGEQLRAGTQKRYGWLQENFNRLERVKELAAQKNASIGAVVLSYLMSDTHVPTAAVTAFTKQEQFDEILESTKVHLSEQERKFLAGC